MYLLICDQRHQTPSWIQLDISLCLGILSRIIFSFWVQSVKYTNSTRLLRFDCFFLLHIQWSVVCLFSYASCSRSLSFLKILKTWEAQFICCFFPLPEESSSTKSSFSWISGTLLSDIPKIEVTSVLAWLFCKWNCECDCFKTLLAQKKKMIWRSKMLQLVIIIIFDAFPKVHTVLATQIWIFKIVFFFGNHQPLLVYLISPIFLFTALSADSSVKI